MNRLKLINTQLSYTFAKKIGSALNVMKFSKNLINNKEKFFFILLKKILKVYVKKEILKNIGNKEKVEKLANVVLENFPKIFLFSIKNFNTTFMSIRLIWYILGELSKHDYSLESYFKENLDKLKLLYDSADKSLIWNYIMSRFDKN